MRSSCELGKERLSNTPKANVISTMAHRSVELQCVSLTTSVDQLYPHDLLDPLDIISSALQGRASHLRRHE